MFPPALPPLTMIRSGSMPINDEFALHCTHVVALYDDMKRNSYPLEYFETVVDCIKELEFEGPRPL